MILMNGFRQVAIAAAILALPLAAQASVMYSTGGGGTQLWKIDTTTGAGTLVGNTNVGGTYGAAFGTDGNLYTVTNSGSAAAQVARFNLTTGAATAVTGASLGVTNLMALEFASDGTFYAASWTTNALYKINLATGLATQVGALGFSGIMDMAFDTTGTLWGVSGSSLYTINTTTGAGTLKTTLGSFSCSMGIAFDSSNTLLATDYCASNSGIYKVDTVTGTTSLIGYTGINAPHGGDIALTAPNPVPEPATWTLTALGLAAVAATRRHMRR